MTMEEISRTDSPNCITTPARSGFPMTFPFPKFSWLSCAACCALAGCCLTPKTRSACSDCVPSAVAEVSTTYENYTPPQPTLMPFPGVEAPPSPDEQPVPPPPTTRVPNSQVDFFEPAGIDRSQNTR